MVEVAVFCFDKSVKSGVSQWVKVHGSPIVLKKKKGKKCSHLFSVAVVPTYLSLFLDPLFGW